MATVTDFYPDASPESTTVDGVIDNANQTTWTLARDATTGTLANDSSSDFLLYASKTANFYCLRALLLFNTGATIGATDIIDSAVLTLTGKGAGNGDTSRSFAITQAKTDSDTSLSTGDFDSYVAKDTPDEGASRILYSDWNVTTANDFTLNATGEGWISRSGEQKPAGKTAGITYIMVREGEKDIDDVAPTDHIYEGFLFADNGTGKPKLTVTWSVPSGTNIKSIAGVSNVS